MTTHPSFAPWTEPVLPLAGTPPQTADRTARGQSGELALDPAQALFDALLDKHSPTAAHSLRTTLGCAIWAERLELPQRERDAIETAALLHDVGKLVAPNRILHKPGPLTDAERLLLEGCRKTGIDLVREQIELPTVSEIIRFSQSWYDGSQPAADARGDELPLGARVLAIIDALDAMTTQQVYRPALSLSEALGELKRFAGQQFDPVLVHQLCSLPQADLEFLYKALQRQWSFVESDPTEALFLPSLQPDEEGRPPISYALFHEHLLEHLREAVIFVDASLNVALWNRGAERLTGLTAEQVVQREWIPHLVCMRDVTGAHIHREECPARMAMTHAQPWTRRVLVKGEQGHHVAVDLRVVPVLGPDGKVQGATLLMHDLSPELMLRERCANLQQLMARDALTQVANRAEFDRAHGDVLRRAQQQGEAYCLVLCDIDHFKRINDTYGHPAGDAVLRSFGKLLLGQCRREDVVARYGGEEFAIICPGCNLAGARRRAEVIRHAVEAERHPVLGGEGITASFGIAQFEPGDDCQTVIARADKGLYQAKAEGRNRVVVVGSVDHRAAAPAAEELLTQTCLSSAPRAVVFEKLRGFVEDYGAEIESAQEQYMRMRLDVAGCQPRRRSNDRSLVCTFELRIEPLGAGQREKLPANARTRLTATLFAVRSRDRRREDALRLARQALACFRSHMMVLAEDVEPVPGESAEYS